MFWRGWAADFPVHYMFLGGLRMAHNESFECDGCGKDITYTANGEDYRLVLTVANKIPWYVGEGLTSGFVTSMAIPRPISRRHDFCDIACLDLWRDRENYESTLWRGFNENWQREHGTWEGGRCRSYPCPPEELRKAKAGEFKASSLTAFPLKNKLPA
jgi:hypothetical protein